MEKELEQFRQEVERLREGRRGGSGPFPEPLRAFAVRYLAYALEKGDTVKAVVERLGVSEPTLQAWRRGQTPGSKARRSELPQAGAEERSVAPQAAASKEPMKEKTPRRDWAELLRRTFALDVFACVRCGGRRRVLAYVTAGGDSSGPPSMGTSRRRGSHLRLQPLQPTA